MLLGKIIFQRPQCSNKYTSTDNPALDFSGSLECNDAKSK